MASASASASFVPLILLILVQLAYAWMNISSKLAILGGMNPLILVSYRQIFAFVSIAPFAYWLERDMVPKMTKRIMVQLLLSSLTGVTGSQILYFMGLKYSTATIACALTNLDTAFTFVLAILFRQENLGIKKKSGVAKVVGTVMCVGGAIVLSFYHAKVIDIPESRIHWSYADKLESGAHDHNSSSAQSNSLLGPVLLILNALVWSLWFIIQANMSKTFPVPYTSTAYTCLLGSLQCVISALCLDHSPSAWSLHDTMRLASSLYAGVICTGISFPIISWAIDRKGPLYVSVFTPLQLIVTAFISWAFLQEKLYVGTAIGSLLIVGGLYGFLWGKSKEVAIKKDNEALVMPLPPSIKKDDEVLVMPLPLPIKKNKNKNKIDIELQS